MPRTTRRRFLAGAAGLGAAAAAGYAARSPLERAFGLGRQATTPHGAAPAPSSTTTPGILVLVTLYGGNDGLNTVIPYADAAYQGGRPGLAQAPNDVIRLDPTLGLHPALTGLKGLWDAHQLAIVLGVGYPDPNRSHFRSMDIWQSAVPETDEPTGWLGRWLDAQPRDPMRALGLGATLPLLLQGADVAASSIPTGRLAIPGGAAQTSLFGSLETTYNGEAGLAAMVAESGSDLLVVLHDVSTILSSSPSVATPANLEPSAPGPTTTGGPTTGPGPTTTTAVAGSGSPPAARDGGELAAQLDVVSRLIRGGAPTQVYEVALGGFDTHAGERANHDRLMTELDAAVSGFLTGLSGSPAGQRVVLATYSEFGRRVGANASGGTDHGTAAPLFVAGPRVKGGFYGSQPSLTDLDQGDLKFTTDFRAVYTTLIGDVLGTDPSKVLNGKTFTPVPFL